MCIASAIKELKALEDKQRREKYSVDESISFLREFVNDIYWDNENTDIKEKCKVILDTLDSIESKL